MDSKSALGGPKPISRTGILWLKSSRNAISYQTTMYYIRQLSTGVRYIFINLARRWPIRAKPEQHLYLNEGRRKENYLLKTSQRLDPHQINHHDHHHHQTIKDKQVSILSHKTAYLILVPRRLSFAAPFLTAGVVQVGPRAPPLPSFYFFQHRHQNHPYHCPCDGSSPTLWIVVKLMKQQSITSYVCQITAVQ